MKRKGYFGKCIFCGSPIKNKKYLLKPASKVELNCCSKECIEKTKDFINWDFSNRKKFYIIGFLLVIINLLILQFDLKVIWRFVPLICIGILLYIFPLPLHNYTSYYYKGIQKTLDMIKKIGIGIAIVGIFFSFFI